MELNIISLIVSVIAIGISIYVLFQYSNKKEPLKQESFMSAPLQLQAYERLVILVERISIPSLVSRTNISELSAKQMQVILLENIKQEFEYNASQQIYVSPIAWDAVRNLKEENMIIINRVASFLPAEAKAGDLNRQLLDVVLNQQDKVLHSIVLDTLNFEAKKLMR